MSNDLTFLIEVIKAATGKTEHVIAKENDKSRSHLNVLKNNPASKEAADKLYYFLLAKYRKSIEHFVRSVSKTILSESNLEALDQGPHLTLEELHRVQKAILASVQKIESKINSVMPGEAGKSAAREVGVLAGRGKQAKKGK